MGIILKPEDIEPFADIPKDKLEAMIADVEAVAVSVAPCIAKPDFKYKDAAKAILRRALLPWILRSCLHCLPRCIRRGLLLPVSRCILQLVSRGLIIGAA